MYTRMIYIPIIMMYIRMISRGGVWPSGILQLCNAQGRGFKPRSRYYYIFIKKKLLYYIYTMLASVLSALCTTQRNTTNEPLPSLRLFVLQKIRIISDRQNHILFFRERTDLMKVKVSL